MMVLMRQSNRSKLVVTMLSAALLLLAANPVWVQERPDPDELKIVYIAGARNKYWMPSSATKIVIRSHPILPT